MNPMYQLWILEALDDVRDLTATGKKMSEFPMEPSMAKHAHYFRGVQVLRPKQRLEESDAARDKFQVPKCGHLTLPNVYKM
ncbi:hypothetical protein CALVIDRAFT_566927 [Calocera viscosa TUFC12733]|uniref:Helicase associated domain-containing protein n=1 Tax=Calocera viscosa (strain TUFC12733) TaxID=1330018 RepID=A0A167IVZ0_CALVF|nr:hypothetical protein CALVIDRAFT_566927 [Calocera viscosa TUFC12733]